MNTSPDQPLRVCLDARIVSGTCGGVEQYILGLANGLSQLADGEEEYLFLVFAGEDEWLRPHLGGRCTFLISAEQPFADTAKGRLKKAIPFSEQILRTIPAVPGLRRSGPKWSDGTIERSKVDVMHFTGQNAFLTDVPTVYQPHDLQHLHLPQMFTRRERQFRESSYRTHCLRADKVAMMTLAGTRDVTRHYGLPADRVVAIPPGAFMPLPPGAPGSPEPIQTIGERALPDSFLLYPAQTWPHKNHIRLLEALSRARIMHGTTIPLVCTGALNSFYRSIERRLSELELQDQVRFLGFVSPGGLHGLYGRAKGLIFPSLFEGWGMPVSEAFSLSVPVACSNAGALADLVKDAAIVFDPLDVESITRAMLVLWGNDAVRQTLTARGLEIARSLTWERTARTFRALYRRMAGRESEQDRLLLSEPAPV